MNLILGRAGYGKTEYCFRKINALAQSGNKDIILLTPEQYNFTAEKRLLTELGESKINSVQNLSFTRLSNELKRLYGEEPLPVLSKGAKAVLMKKAMESVKAELKVFSGKTKMISFISSMMDIYDEMKSCDKSWQEIRSASEKIDKKLLSGKLFDISLIAEKYEQLISGAYFDSADELTRLYQRLAGTSYIKGKTVFIDGFNGFVANEYKILDLIIKDAKDVYITLTTDSFGKTDESGLFTYINKTARCVLDIAEKYGIGSNIIQLDMNRRAKEKELLFCEKELFSQNGKKYEAKPSNVSVYRAKSTADECDFAGLSIKKLLRSGMKAADITIVCRDVQKYKNQLAHSLRKYEVPFFDDERQSISTQPVIVFVRYLLRTVAYSFRSEDILGLAKTGITALGGNKINALENYIYVWSISGVKKWRAPFVNSASGFKAELSEADEKILQQLNESREYLYSRLSRFKNAVSKASAAEISAAIYNALIAFGANKGLRALAGELSKCGRDVLADEQQRVWNLLMEILNDLAVVSGDEKMSVTEYMELFLLMVNSEDLGVLPQCVDCVQFGQADRIRADNPKAVFLLGANEGEFPKAVSSGGLLTEGDRIILNDNDFNLYSFGETLTYQERYFAYMSAAVASEKLFVSYCMSGKNDAPSVLVTYLTEIFPQLDIISCERIPDCELLESRESAFDIMAQRFDENSSFSQSLKKYFENDGRYSAVKQLYENEDAVLNNKENAKRLFGKDMYLSASRIEDYFNCPYKYFCKFGLSARPLQKAQIDAMQTGTVIHFVLEQVLNEWGSDRLAAESDAHIRVIVNKYVAEYFKTQLGDTEVFTERFKYRFMRISKMLYSVLIRIKQEFSHSSFKAEAFELVIDQDGDVKPAVIPLEDGSVRIRGVVDRVDTLVKDGVKYIKVVDYKSGDKKFNLSDVIYGLNLQMFVYLFSICSDKSSKYCGIPAGVLYMHAARKVYSVSGEDEKTAVEKELNSAFKMKGIVLYDEEHDILNDMEDGIKGEYLPVKLDKGNLKGCFVSLEDLGKIARKINSLVAEMGNDLHGGRIAQNPISGNGHDKTCDICDYSDVCAAKKYINKREIVKMSDEQVISALEEVGESETVD